MKKVKLVGIYVLAAFIAFITYFFAFSDLSVFQSETSLSHNEKLCRPVPITVGNKTVILRVDDIQAQAWYETSIAMIKDAEARGIPLTLGIIPKNFADDTELVETLRQHSCNLEFALHGWDHSSGEEGANPEFASLNKKEALERIRWGIDVLKVLTDEPVVTWIPPLNVYSTGTAAALKELGITHISAEGESGLDYDATTFDYGVNSLVLPHDVVAKCGETFKTKTTCVIMIHPQDFADGLDHDEKKYQVYYIYLLEQLKKKGYTFARFKDL
jgi:peptidoglycan/xylan/chitin deacetylase (PgdA/CDA1 family)